LNAGARVLLIIPRPEEHTFGAFVVADQIRRHGCEVDIAMDLHPRQIAEKVRKTRYHMVGITASGRRSLASARELVEIIKTSVTRVTPYRAWRKRGRGREGPQGDDGRGPRRDLMGRPRSGHAD
jgi:hypothetical protein